MFGFFNMNCIEYLFTWYWALVATSALDLNSTAMVPSVSKGAIAFITFLYAVSSASHFS